MFNQKLKAQLQACQTRLDEEQGIIEAIKAGAATVIFSPEGIIQEASTPFLALMGYGAAELIGLPHSQLCPRAWGSPVTIASSGAAWPRGRCSQAPSSA